MTSQWNHVLDSENEAPICNNKLKYATLTSQPITLADTTLGRHQKIIVRQANKAITNMLQKERDEESR